nr:methyltransferase type 11 [Sporichthyaceae bacterium]
SVDVAMLRHVLAHNGGREQAIVDHLATLVRPGGSVYLVDVDATAMRMHPPDAAGSVVELVDCYERLHAGLGNDLSVGLRLGELLDTAGLEQVDHQGHYQIVRAQPGLRPPPWAARDQMLAAGLISEDDISRWSAEFERFDRGEWDFTLFAPIFTASARKPA